MDPFIEEIAVACQPDRPIQLGITVVQAKAHIGGLHITGIQRDSCIDRNGRFSIGDIIVKVNDVSLKDVRFKEAQILLKNELKIRHSNNVPLILTVLHNGNNDYQNNHSTVDSLNNSQQQQQTVNSQHHPTNDERNQAPNQITHRSSFSSLSSSSQNATNNSPHHFVGALNTRKIGVVHRIKLVKRNEGLGFKIAKRDNQTGAQCPIYITTINPTGAAVRDGRLEPGDMLLEVNGQTMAGKSQEEAAAIFKGIGINQTADIVISRLEEVEQADREVSDSRFESMNDGNVTQVPSSDLDYGETLVFDVPLNDTKSAGLGIALKGPRVAMDGRPIDLGIWVDKIITGGAASKDGRLMPDDQIIAINGINLIGLSNAKAKETLTMAACRGEGPDAAPSIIRLTVLRRTKQSKTPDETRDTINLDGEFGNAHENPDAVYINGNSTTLGQDGSNSSVNAAQSSGSHSSFLTVIDQNIGSSTQTSSSDSSQENHSYNISSPLTQASNSLRLGSVNDKSDDSGKTLTSVTSPSTELTNLGENSNGSEEAECRSTQPKVIDDLADSLEPSEPNSMTPNRRSIDDEPTESETAEHFQRDGFGRQSISEKRHAQLSAMNTDTYRRSRKAKEERERQLRQESEIERKKLIEQANSRRSLNLGQLQRHNNLDSGVSSSEDTRAQNIARVKAFCQTAPKQQINSLNDKINHNFMRATSNGNHRELPVDVYMPSTQSQSTLEPDESKFVDVTREAIINGTEFTGYNNLNNSRHDRFVQGYRTVDARSSRSRSAVTNNGVSESRHLFAPTCCWKCRSPGICPYHGNRSVDSSDQSFDNRIPSENEPLHHGRLKKSSSFESIHQGYPAFTNPIDPFTGNGPRPFVTRQIADNLTGTSTNRQQLTDYRGKSSELRPMNQHKESDASSNSKRGINFFRFFKLGSRKGKKNSVQDNCAKISDKIDTDSHELSDETTSSQSRFINGALSHTDPQDDRFMGMAKQDAQREQDLINEHYMKMLQQQQMHHSAQSSRAQTHYYNHTGAATYVPRPPIMHDQIPQAPPQQYYQHQYQYSYPSVMQQQQHLHPQQQQLQQQHQLQMQRQHPPRLLAKPQLSNVMRHPRLVQRQEMPHHPMMHPTSLGMQPISPNTAYFTYV